MVRTFSRMERRLEQGLALTGFSLPQFDLLATLAAGGESLSGNWPAGCW